MARRSPGFVALAVGMPALGVGMDVVFLPLPYANTQRLWKTVPKQNLVQDWTFGDAPAEACGWGATIVTLRCC